MCDLCGCNTYIDSGKQAAVNRAQEIIRRLDLTAENIEFKQGRKPAGEGGRILTLDKLRNH